MHIISDSFGIFIDCFFYRLWHYFFWCQNLKTDTIFNNHKWHSKCLPINSKSSDQMSTHTTTKINIQRVKGINQNSIQFFQIFGIHFKYLSISQKIHTNHICSVQITQLFFLCQHRYQIKNSNHRYYEVHGTSTISICHHLCIRYGLTYVALCFLRTNHFFLTTIQKNNINVRWLFTNEWEVYGVLKIRKKCASNFFFCFCAKTMNFHAITGMKMVLNI